MGARLDGCRTFTAGCLASTAFVLGAFGSDGAAPAALLPPAWQQAWESPPVELRPLQIVHGVRPEEARPEAMAAFKRKGLGGIVCNVDFAEYMTSQPRWQTLVRAVDACKQAGLVVWLYDEEGYPSGAAGGLVLKANPAYEAVALVYDSAKPDPFSLRPSYEHTHACNNFYAARRYPNLLDDRATRCFLEQTHQAYWQRLEPHFGATIRALFTDEPSLMAVNLGPLAESVRKNVRVVDPVDEKVKALPSIPWCDELPGLYKQRYGQDLALVRQSLFVGDSDADREVRRRFWALIAELITERYHGKIQAWCRAHGVASSGHNLWEEEVLHHVPLYGNSLKTLGRMDIPGLDMLSSDPAAVVYGAWMAAALPASAALFNGGRRVMTEVSDFAQQMSGKGPAPLEQMQATAAWQAALGVTEFTSYYGSIGRMVTAVEAEKKGVVDQKTRQYCDFIGRLNAILREAQPEPNVLLYYPIYDLWAEYRPVAEPLRLESQSRRAQQLVNSFRELGRRLLVSQVSFALIDHDTLGGAEAREDGLLVKGRKFDALLLPAGAQLPPPLGAIAERLAAFGRLMQEGDPARAVDFNRLSQFRPLGCLEPACEKVVLGRFVRDGRRLLLYVNVGAKAYEGRVRVVNGAARWCQADPATGQIAPCKVVDADAISVSLPVNAALLFIGPPPKDNSAAQRQPKNQLGNQEKKPS
jgi:hypothetical protein